LAELVQQALLKLKVEKKGRIKKKDETSKNK